MPVTINGNGAISGLVITTADLADASVTTAKIADGAVATVDIADSAVTSAKIADGTIVTGDLADGAVTSAKLASGAAVANIGFTPANSTATVNLSGDQTVGGTKTFTNGIRFNNGTTQTSAATAYSPAYGAIGSTFVGMSTSAASSVMYEAGTTVAGSSLRTRSDGVPIISSIPVAYQSNPGLGGTWVACNRFFGLYYGSTYTTLWLRIS